MRGCGWREGVLEGGVRGRGVRGWVGEDMKGRGWRKRGV